MDIRGVLVLYNPTMDTLINIERYINRLQRLYVIDNSDDRKIDIKTALERFGDSVFYYSCGNNLGIATALNIGCRLAQQDGAHWALTMDQDSMYAVSAIDLQIKAFKQLSAERSQQVGILSPNHFIEGKAEPECPVSLTEHDSVMTSGNLVNLSIYSTIGGFRDDFFIDEVDIEFCRRVTESGYKIMVANNAVLYHFLGDTRKHHFIFFSIMCSHHSYVRRYYITRNRLYMTRLYPDLRWEYYLRNLVSLLKVIALEKDKWRKIKAFFEGIRDNFEKRYGKKSFRY